jgi:hypothetical protein
MRSPLVLSLSVLLGLIFLSSLSTSRASSFLPHSTRLDPLLGERQTKGEQIVTLFTLLYTNNYLYLTESTIGTTANHIIKVNPHYPTE